MRLTGLENSFPKITKGPHTFPNALDFATDQERKTRDEQSNIVGLENLGLEVEHIDLRNYLVSRMN